MKRSSLIKQIVQSANLGVKTRNSGARGASGGRIESHSIALGNPDNASGSLFGCGGCGCKMTLLGRAALHFFGQLSYYACWILTNLFTSVVMAFTTMKLFLSSCCSRSASSFPAFTKD